MNSTYEHINALSKAVYDRWKNDVSFDFASFAVDNDEKAFRITWTFGVPTLQNTMGGGYRIVPRYQFECVRYLRSQESNVYQFLADYEAFITLLSQQDFTIAALGAFDTGTPDRLAAIIECHR